MSWRTVVNQVRHFEEKVAPFLVLEIVFSAEAEFLGNARDAERPAGEAAAEMLCGLMSLSGTE